MPLGTTSRLMLASALLLALAFALIQPLTVNNPNFLIFLFLSLVFLGTGTFLMMASAPSSKDPFRSAFAVILLVASLFAVVSLIEPATFLWGSRGYSNDHFVNTANFVLTANRSSATPNYQAEHSQVLYSAPYSVTSVILSSFPFSSLEINVSFPADLQGRAFVYVEFSPYEQNVYGSQYAIAFNTSTRSIIVDTETIFQAWGNGHTIFDGYNVVFKVRLDLNGNGPSQLNFTVNANYPQFFVRDFAVSSSFQNGLAITFSGLLIGVNAYVLGEDLIEFLTRERKNSQVPTIRSSSEI